MSSKILLTALRRYSTEHKGTFYKNLTTIGSERQMGSGIAQASAQADSNVVLVDQGQAVPDKAKERIDERNVKRVAKKQHNTDETQQNIAQSKQNLLTNYSKNTAQNTNNNNNEDWMKIVNEKLKTEYKMYKRKQSQTRKALRKKLDYLLSEEIE